MIAALFPGQGSQTVGMAKDLYDGSAAAKAVLDEAEAALPGLLSSVADWGGAHLIAPGLFIFALIQFVAHEALVRSAGRTPAAVSMEV